MGFDTGALDLSYITENLAVCSAPSDGMKGKVTKNDLDSLINILNANHGKNHWKIINLRAEGVGYNYDKIVKSGGKFEWIGTVDHQSIPIKTILKIVRVIDEFIQLERNNVIVVHCKYGKGRSGQVICSYLMYRYGLHREAANEIFKERRRSFKSGVTIKSQLRYLDYFDLFLKNDRVKKVYKCLVHCDYNITVTNCKIIGAWPENINYTNLANNQDFFSVCVNTYQHPTELSHCSVNSTIIKEVAEDKNLVHNVFIEFPESMNICNEADIGIYISSKYNFGKGRYWLNIPMELAKIMLGESKSKKKLLQKPSINFKPIQLAISKQLLWESFEGFHGSVKKGLKLFEHLDLQLAVRLNVNIELSRLINEYI